MLWTQFILIWAVYSSFFTPLEFGFFRGLPENLFLLDIAGQIAFLIDIIVRFFVGYWDSHSHRMVFNHNLIAIRLILSHYFFYAYFCYVYMEFSSNENQLKMRNFITSENNHRSFTHISPVHILILNRVLIGV